MFERFFNSADKIQNLIAAILTIIIATGVLHSLSLNLLLPGSIFLITATDMLNMAITGAPITINVLLILTPIFLSIRKIRYTTTRFISLTTIVLACLSAVLYFNITDQYNTKLYLNLILLVFFIAFLAFISILIDYSQLKRINYSILLFIVPFIYFMSSVLLFFVLMNYSIYTNQYFDKDKAYICTDRCQQGTIISSVGEFLVVKHADEEKITYFRKSDVTKYYTTSTAP